MDDSNIPIIDISLDEDEDNHFSANVSVSSASSADEYHEPPQLTPPPAKKSRSEEEASSNDYDSSGSESNLQPNSIPSTSGTKSQDNIGQGPKVVRRSRRGQCPSNIPNGVASGGANQQDSTSSSSSTPSSSSSSVHSEDIFDNYYKVRRITDWRVQDGSFSFFVEWDEFPGENTWEPLDAVCGTVAFTRFESDLIACLDMVSAEEHTEMTAKKLIGQLSTTLSSFLKKRKLALLKLFLPGKRITDLLAAGKRNSDKSKQLDRVINQINRQYAPFWSPQVIQYEKRKENHLQFRALLFMLFKMLKTSDLSKIFSAEEDFKAAGEKSQGRLAKLKAKAEKECDLSVENEYDFELLPRFKYTSLYFLENRQPDPPKITCKEGCFCTKRDMPINCPCLLYTGMFKAKNRQIYSGNIVTDCSTNVLFECNDSCGCKKKCNNRLTQSKPPFAFCIFRTEDRGWGLKTLTAIPKGSFVHRMAGELKSVEQVINEHNLDDNKELNAYAFVLDGLSLDPASNMVVDCRDHGNIARFLNHSCEPNLAPYFVLSGSYNVNQPYVAFFADKDIEENTELTFCYPEQYWWKQCKPLPPVKCCCKSSHCRRLVAGRLEWFTAFDDAP